MRKRTIPQFELPEAGEVFNLVSEKGTDYERQEAERREAKRRAAEAARITKRQQITLPF